jgi:capsule biosynthesis phosphatase
LKRLVCDLDGTLTLDEPDIPYPDKKPNQAVVERLVEYRAAGFEIVIFSARQMRTFDGNVGLINIHTLPVITAWLDTHGVPYDEILVGKPWCGYDGFYVDDRAVRPSEFATKSYEEIVELLALER